MDEECFDESALFSTFEIAGERDLNGITPKQNEELGTTESESLSELDSLKEENNLLKKIIQKIALPPGQQNGDPVASIVYYDRPCSRTRATDIEEFVKNIAAKDEDNCAKPDNADVLNTSPGRNSSSFCDAFSLALRRRSRPREQDDKLDLSCIPLGIIQYFRSFCLDRFGSAALDSCPRAPPYEQVYFNVLPYSGVSGKRNRQKLCFNCDGDHKMQDCPKPKDLVKISAKKQEFRNSFSSPYCQEARYHKEKAESKKYEHLQPGRISKNLREALGLSNHDLPPFIYRMRMLGYPPGWLPSNSDSGIVMYGKEGKVDESDGEERRLNEDKLVHFPGFNVAAPKGTRDLAFEVRLPVMNPRDELPVSRDAEPSEMAGQKRRLSSGDDGDRAQIKKRWRSGTETDMDIEDSEEIDRITVNDSPTWSQAPETPRNATGGRSLRPEAFPRTSTPANTRKNDLEDGEIPDSPVYLVENEHFSARAEEVEAKMEPNTPSWWLGEPLQEECGKIDEELVPPPFPLRPLPLHKISQILPGDMNHVSFEDRGLWLDPIFGNLQVRTGRYDKLKTILANRVDRK